MTKIKRVEKKEKKRQKRKYIPPKPLPPVKGKLLNKSRVLRAVEGTGGILKTIAGRLGVTYGHFFNQVRDNQSPDWDEIRQAISIERERIGDIAECTVQEMMCQRLDFNTASGTARWYLERKHPERGFKEKKELTLEGGKNPLNIRSETYVPLEELDLPIDVRKQILAAIEKKQKEQEGEKK